ncbi:MAG: helix-turn-helix domain-containing protein [Paludibacter sp.]|nr:helix-turn-helix domain-containing protein [Paludibacter sp.]
MEITKKILSFDEACQYTGISKSFLYKLTSARKIEYSKPTGKLIFFEREILDNFLLSNKITTQQEIETQAQKYCMTTKKGGNK